MESKDCPDPRAHTIALEAAAKSKNLEAGQMLFQLAKSSHIRLRPSLYTAALKVAVQCETLDWARSLFAELIQLKPSAHLSQLPYLPFLFSLTFFSPCFPPSSSLAFPPLLLFCFLDFNKLRPHDISSDVS